MNFPVCIFYCIHEAGGTGLEVLINYDHDKFAKEVWAERGAAMKV